MTRRARGQALIVVGGFLGFGILLHLGEEYSGLVYVVALAVFCVLPVALGFVTLRSRGKRTLTGEDGAWEAELLRLAKQRGGSLTVAEAVAYCDLSRDEAEQRLDDLCKSGFAEVRVSQDGVLVYQFEGFLSLEQKSRAKGVLDA